MMRPVQQCPTNLNIIYTHCYCIVNVYAIGIKLSTIIEPYAIMYTLNTLKKKHLFHNTYNK